MAATTEAEKTAAATKRVVLKRELVLTVDAAIDPAKVAEAAKLLKLKASDVHAAWCVVGRGDGSKTSAIESHAGKPGSPDALVGTYKAPNVAAWAGGETYEAPPRPLVERRPFEDETDA